MPLTSLTRPRTCTIKDTVINVTPPAATIPRVKVGGGGAWDNDSLQSRGSRGGIGVGPVRHEGFWREAGDLGRLVGDARRWSSIISGYGSPYGLRIAGRSDGKSKFRFRDIRGRESDGVGVLVMKFNDHWCL